MKSTAQIVIKALLLLLILVLLVILLIPAPVKLKEIKPLLKSTNTKTSEKAPDTPAVILQPPDVVALLFGWSRPAPTFAPRPQRTPGPIIPDIEIDSMVAAPKKASITRSDGTIWYWCKKLNVEGGFYIAFNEVVNPDGYQLLKIQSDGYLVSQNGQKKIIKYIE